MQEEKGLILSNKKLAKDTYRMEIQASIAKEAGTVCECSGGGVYAAPPHQHLFC